MLCYVKINITSLLGIHIVQITSLRERPRLPSYFLSILSSFPIHVSWEPDQSYHVVSLSWQEQSACLSYATVCRWLLTGGTVIPVSLIAVVPTFQEKSVFYGYLTAASVSVGLPTQFVHCCLVTARAFMPASLTVIPYTILEISKFLGQLLFWLTIDDDYDDDEKLNPGIASLRSE